MHIISGLGDGGAQKLLADILPRINNQKGVYLEVLALSNNNDLFGKTISDSGIKINYTNINSSYSFKNIIEIRKFIKEGKFDIVHVHLFPTLYWVAFATLFYRNKPKLVFTEHSTHNRRRDIYLFRFIDRLIYSRYNRIFSISIPTRKKLLHWLRIDKPSNKYPVVLNGVDQSVYSNAKKINLPENKMNDHTKKVKLAMVSRFSHQKDQLTIIRSLKLLPKDIVLLLVGDGAFKKKLQDYVTSKGLENRVYFLGYREDVPSILKSVDIVIQSSHWEGFGLAIVEAMAAGKPVIASDVPGLSDVVSDYGMIFERGNYKELAEKIMILLKDSQKMKYYRKKSLERSNKYSIEKTVKDYYNHYYSLMK